jgi:hypothetical protein
MQGRDLTYVLPPHAVRVLSLVTADAPDIRDSSSESFSVIESLTLRAGTLEVIAITLAVLGVLMIVVVLIRLFAGLRTGETEGKPLIGPYGVLAHAARALTAAQRDAEGGWNEALIGRALAATRVAAASALARPVSQRPTDSTAETGEGRVVARQFFGWGKSTALAGAATTEDVARAIARLPGSADGDVRQALEELHAALSALGQVQYGRQTAPDRTALDAALASAISATRRLKSRQMWPRPLLRRFAARQAVVERQA